MTKSIAMLLAVAALSAGAGCAYGGAAGVGTDKVVIARNDGFLFGILRKVFVCKVADSGVTSCQSNEAP